MKHLRIEIGRGQELSGICGEPRLGSFAVADNDCPAFVSDAKKQDRKIIRQTNAAVTRGIAWQLSGVKRNSAPGQPLHIRHGRVVISLGTMRGLFLENVEHARRGGAPFASATDARTTDKDSVTINMHRLLR